MENTLCIPFGVVYLYMDLNEVFIYLTKWIYYITKYRTWVSQFLWQSFLFFLVACIGFPSQVAGDAITLLLMVQASTLNPSRDGHRLDIIYATCLMIQVTIPTIVSTRLILLDIAQYTVPPERYIVHSKIEAVPVLDFSSFSFGGKVKIFHLSLPSFIGGGRGRQNIADSENRAVILAMLYFSSQCEIISFILLDCLIPAKFSVPLYLFNSLLFLLETWHFVSSLSVLYPSSDANVLSLLRGRLWQ